MDSFQDYWDALDRAGPRLVELILDRAARDDGISLEELRRLVDRAYPEPWA